MVEIRAENPSDYETVYFVNLAAFEGELEARLVNALRSAEAGMLSLVAEADGRVCGHVFFSPVTSDENLLNKKVLGLAPLAVLPDFQNRGVGSALTRAALEQCTILRFDGVVVLGSSTYYSRFGFRPASDFNLTCEYPVAPEHFMALELQPRGLEGCRGITRYHRLFNDLEV